MIKFGSKQIFLFVLLSFLVVASSASAGDFTKHTIDSEFGGAQSVYATDVNGDGDVDILGAASDANEITWWENSGGSSPTWTKHTIDSGFNGAYCVYATDVNGDGDVDVLGSAALGADDITWWENSGGSSPTWTKHTIDSGLNLIASVYATDVNGDGDVDVLGAVWGAHEITWWENSGGSSPTWTKHTIDSSFGGAMSVYATDVNGDGDVDILGAAYAANDITWWENSGGSSPTWTKHTIDSSFGNAMSVYATDVNGDGDVDILGAAWLFTNDITWWENSGGSSPTWTKHTIDSSFDGARSVYATDVNGDGDVDILGAASSEGITWWENSGGSSPTWTEHTIDISLDGPHSVYATDVNGDTYVDVLGAAWIDGIIAWWEGSPTLSTWDGSSSTDWDTAANWDLGATPGSTDTVVIANVTNQPVLGSAVTMGNLTINSGATLDLNGYNLTVTGTVSNSGTVILEGSETVTWTNDITSGRVKYDGTGAVAGDSYYNLEFDNASGSWGLDANLDVDGTFDLTNGTFDMNDKDMNVAGNFTIASGATFTKGTGTLTLDGDLSYADNTSPQQDVGAVAIGTSPDTTTLTSDMTASSLIINEGDTLITDGYNLYISGDLTVNGTLNASSGAGGDTTIEVGGDWIIGPNGSVAGTEEKMIITKDANKKEVNVGEVITYTITIENKTSISFTSDVTIEDTIPGGFKYINDSAQLDGSAISNPTGNRPLSFNVGTIDKDAVKTLKYQLVVGSGVTFGNYENTAVAKLTGGAVISNAASEAVKVIPDPMFDLGTIIGKVFWDRDENGRQTRDEGREDEMGISQVRIVMEDGAVITTDKDGKYHAQAIMPGRHILRLDETTLPEGFYLTTDKAVIIDITEGLLVKVNFGVNAESAVKQLPVRIIQRKQIPRPALNIGLYPETLVYKGGELKTGQTPDNYEFRIFTNHSLFIQKWQIDILDKDTKRIIRTFSGTQSGLTQPILWDGKTDKGRYLSVDKDYVYTLTVEDKQGDTNKTKEKELRLINYEPRAIKTISKEEEKEKKQTWLEKESKTNSLETQNINIEGDVILIESEKTFESSIKEVKRKISPEESRKLNVKIDDTQIPLIANNEKKISQEVIIPKGEHEVVVEFIDENGEKKQYTKDIGVKENYLFFVALGDTKAGYTVHKGSIEPIKHDDKYRDGFWSEGKLAYYLKGKLKGKYLITSSLDTDRDKKELFRNLSPDKFYPVYGDASTIDYKATDTQGALYLLIEWDKSSLLWGNYVTGLTETDLARFNRSLYGGKIDYESVAVTKFGEPKTRLIVFHAKAQQRAAHNELMGTGGSLYYLKNKDVIDGSEKIKLEVRDKVTGLVLAEKSMQEGTDYEIDYSNGRITFWEPVLSVAESGSIISTQILGGNPVYVIVDYEYETKDKYAEGTVGGRLEQAVTDYLRVGATYVSEEQTNKNYELKGLDTTIPLGQSTQITAEYAESESEEVNSYISTDGGLSFTQLQTGDDAGGKAYGIKGKSYLFDNRLGVESYYKKIERNFSSTSTVSQQGKELMGGGFTYDITPGTRIKVKHDIQKLLGDGNEQTQLQVGAKETQATTAQLTHKKGKLTLTGEYRHQSVEEKIEQYESETNTDEEIIAAKAEYELSEKTTLSLAQQAALGGISNHQTTAGIERQFNDYLSLSAEETVGAKGSATTLGAVFKGGDKLEVVGGYTMANYANEGDKASITTRAMKDENTEVYHTYFMSETRNEGKKFASLFGAKEKLSNDMELTMENERSLSDEGINNTNIFGLSGDINDKWAGRASFEKGEVQNHDGTQYKRNAASVGLGYAAKDPETGDVQLKASSKLELRMDEGQEDKRQYLICSAIEGKVNPDTTLFTKLNYSQTENTTTDSTEAQYKEFVTGLAYRPLDNDRLNLLAKYSYLEDDSPSSQTDISDIEKEKAHVLAGECIYDITDKWQLSEKLALKIGEERVTGFDFTKTQTWLNINRLNYNLNKNWQIAGEYRFLRQQEAKDCKQGVLIEGARNIGDFVQIGVGYNFTDFNDDLTHLDYTSQGPFIRITGKLYDRTPEEKLRARHLRLEEQIEKWAWSRVLNKTAKEDTPIMQELYTYYEKAKNLEQQGRLKEAKEYYKKIVKETKSIYAEAEEYIEDHIELEKELKGNYQETMEYYKSRRIKKVRDLLQEIVNKGEGGIK